MVITSNAGHQMDLLLPTEAAYFTATGKIRPFRVINGSCKGSSE